MRCTFHIVLDALPVAIDFTVAVCIDDQLRLVQSNIGILHRDIVVTKICRLFHVQRVTAILDIVGMRIIFIRVCRVGQFQIFQKFGRIITIHFALEVAGIILVYSAIGSGHIIRVYRGFSLGQNFRTSNPTLYGIVWDGIRKLCINGISAILHMVGLVSPVSIFDQSFRRSRQPHFLFQVGHFIPIHDCRFGIPDMGSPLDIGLDSLPVPIDLAVAIRVDDQFSLIQVHFLGIANHDIVVGQIAGSSSFHVIPTRRRILGVGTIVFQSFGNIIGHFDQLIDGFTLFIHRIFGVSIGKTRQIVSGLGVFLDFRGLTIDPMDIFRVHGEFSLGHINGPGGGQIVVVSDVNFISVRVCNLQAIKGNGIIVCSMICCIAAAFVLCIVTIRLDGSRIRNRTAIRNICLGILPVLDRAVRIAISLGSSAGNAGRPFLDFQFAVFRINGIPV